MRIRARRIGTISAAAALLFGTACGGSERAPDALDKFYRQSPQWVSCAEFQDADEIAGAGYQCAHVEVPLNYAEPAGATARIAISRRPADGDRIGSLLTNPGGPGAPGLTYPAVLAKTPLAQRFDLIGVDVRGLGASTPTVTCLTEEEFQAQRSDLDLDFSPAGIAHTEQEHRDYVAKCVERTGLDVLAHVGTADVARDFDVIRAVLGDPKLNYFGGSYGTRLGSTMAELFPERIRAMVLDGGVDPATNMIDPVTFSAGFQHAFEAFAAACVKTPTCPIGVDPDPARVRTAVRALLDPLIERPAATSDQRGLGYSDASAGIGNSLYTPDAWPRLTQGLTELTEGRGDTLLAVADFFARPDTVARDLHNAVMCREEVRVTDRAAAAELDRRTRAAAPIFDDGRASGQAPLDLCAFWPLPPASQPHVPDVTGLPPVLVVAATGDPATPYPGGAALARALHAPLITYESVQHGAFGDGVACVDEPVLRYLIDLALPPEDVRCAHAE
ncbi:alpha/beta hydrolase [Nocardia brasiliensis]|uniref:alpha/beta hydrolase n=1 Tax=Nocardia brasiliensis TaxID=37326 RepID=UPI00068BABA8|nr:alpha/beta hydrolase [Nocardia brasiliensis]